MNLWGTPDRYLAVTDTALRRAALSDDLVSEIADALATAGEYIGRIELRPTQQLVDFNWAARQAGRRLGIRIDVDMTITKSLDGLALMRVTAPSISRLEPDAVAEGVKEEDTPLAPPVRTGQPGLIDALHIAQCVAPRKAAAASVAEKPRTSPCRSRT